MIKLILIASFCIGVAGCGNNKNKHVEKLGGIFYIPNGTYWELGFQGKNYYVIQLSKNALRISNLRQGLVISNFQNKNQQLYEKYYDTLQQLWKSGTEKDTVWVVDYDKYLKNKK